MTGLKPIRRALLSVTDKSGLVEFARQLGGLGVDLVSTGGTARALREAGLKVRDISELTGFPEMLGGRVKTLHPRVHGGILHVRENPEHVAAIKTHEIEPIDMVVVNLYAFEKTAQKEEVAFAEIVENIDIGGPSMVRSAAKNFEDVAVVTATADYEMLSAELAANQGSLSRETRWRLAQHAFALTAAYDAAIAATLRQTALPEDTDSPARGHTEGEFPQVLEIKMPLKMRLRYGENPHQRAALYSDGSRAGVAGADPLQGKELSYNNLVDLDACWELVSEFNEPAVAIIKHTNPCGAAIGKNVLDAYLRALEADPVSAFGSVVGINREVDGAAAEEIAKLFVEAVAAPSFSPEARQIFAAKKNLRLIAITRASNPFVVKQVSGGMLMQDADRAEATATDVRTVTKRCPTEEEMRDVLFAWRVAKHVKSNAVVYARNGQTVGIGAGQMSRVDAARFGAMKAVLPLAGCVAASDAFFPFADGLEVVAEAGATAVIQPGGSVRDQTVIDAADRMNLAMVLTGIRHFRH